MPSALRTLRRVWAFSLILIACVVVAPNSVRAAPDPVPPTPVPAEATEESQTPTESKTAERPPPRPLVPVEAATDRITITDVIHGQLPGREAIQSLKRALTTPSAASRWGDLPTFGRELFVSGLPSFEPVENGPVGPDYVLGPDDNLVLFVSGLSDTSYSLTLDREGKVFVPRVGTVYLWGLSFADAESLLRSRIANVFRNTRVQVSMGRVRALDIYVVGAVVQPGKYTLTGLASALHALSAAGGPSELGSLRDVRVLRGSQEIGRLDLYQFLLEGDRSQDVRLQTGDVVFTGLAQGHVGIQGEVVRPGVYESVGPVTMRELLSMAGGTTPFADLSRIRIERVDPHGGFRLQDLPLNHGRGVDPDSLVLSNFDLVTVMPLNERVRNLVTLDGFVRHPGEYELIPGLKLSQLVSSDRLLPEADLDQAELRRVDPNTFRVEVRSISLRNAWAGQEDVELRALDAVTVFSSARFPRSVTLEGEVSRPGTYTIAPGERLSQVLERAGGVTDQGSLRAAVFLRASTARREHAIHTEYVHRQRVDLAMQRAQRAQMGDSAGVRSLNLTEASLLAALGAQFDPGRVVLDLDTAGKWVGGDRDPVLEDGDRFIIPIEPEVVTVIGSVMNPGSVMTRRGASFNDYLTSAGGPTREADVDRSYVLRANGAAVPRAQARKVEAGDAIVVPGRDRSHDAGRAFMTSARFLLEIAGVTALILAATR